MVPHCVTVTSRRTPYHAALVLLTVALAVATTRAQIAVSSNDHKAVWVDGVNTVPANPKPDTVTVLDLSGTAPRVIAGLEVPGGWSAPPQSVAIAPDESIALVTSSARLDPRDATRTVFNDVLSVIDLTSSPPRLVSTLRTGQRAAGVSINPSGTLALVANRADGTVSVFRIAGKTVTPASTVDLMAPDSEPSLPVFTPDGRTALVTLNNGHRLAVLSVRNSRVEYTKRDIAAGLRPYGIEVAPSGQVAVVANIGNGPTGGSDTLQVVDLRLDPPRVVDGVFVGMVPEGISMSPDGRFVAAAIQNGAHLAPASPIRHPSGILKVYALSGTRLTHVTEAPIGRWAQGIAWNRQASMLLVQSAQDHRIEVFRFDGRRLTALPSIAINGAPTGIRIAQPSMPAHGVAR
jgi:DNA-binding beta-propeller fold protein YncE